MKAALKNRNLQLYFSGQAVSLIGTWMQQMALSWLVYRLTNSPFMLGVVGFTSQAPSLILTPFIGCILFGVGLLVFGSSTCLPLSLLAMALIGFGSMTTLAGSNMVIQTIVDEDKRGRVMSFVVMTFIGLGPFGGMAAGALANVIGTGRTVVATGVFTLALALIFASRITTIHLPVKPAQVDEGIAEAESELAASKA